MVIRILNFLLLILLSYNCFADNFFLNEQQQAKELFDQKKYQEAAEKFSDSYQKAISYYKLQNYAQAAELFAQKNDFQSQYNLGNSFFMQKKYQEAINSYEKALKLQPKDADAQYNLEIAKKLLQKQEKNKDNNK